MSFPGIVEYGRTITMFELVGMGKKISKKFFNEQEPTLHTELLEAQRLLSESNVSVIIIVSGVDGTGKGKMVDRLNKWLDTRGVKTDAFWEETDEEKNRPQYWKFWRALPPRGTIGIMFGSWHARAIIGHATGRTNEIEFERQLNRITDFERMLIHDDALIIKLWFQLSKKDTLEIARKEKIIVKGLDKRKSLLNKFTAHYDDFVRISEKAIRLTDRRISPWHLIEATDRLHRDLTTGRIVLKAIKEKLADSMVSERLNEEVESVPVNHDTATINILDHCDLTRTISGKEYKKSLKNYQRKLYKLAWEAHSQKKSCVIVFEGWDASGKGGAIRRITSAMDARLYDVISIASPTDEERAHHYLWRFWRRIPLAGYFSIYDRSWYGRVLVERVEKFASETEWSRAYNEINQFEEQLCEHGILLSKFWIHLSEDEQLRRFKERQVLPWKAHKITEVDWRNRDRWHDYREVINDMLIHTSTEYAPWKIIPGNDKKLARIEILKSFCESLEAAL